MAIELPEHTKQQLEHCLAELKRDYKVLNWVDPKNYHITIQFFGEIEDVETVINQIEQAVFEIPSFIIYPLEAGILIRNNILLYVRYQREKILEQIVTNIETIFSINDKRQYFPHTTLARYKVPSKQQYLLLKKKVEHLSFDFEFEVKSIVLYESILKPRGPEYRKIKEFTLAER